MKRSDSAFLGAILFFYYTAVENSFPNLLLSRSGFFLELSVTSFVQKISINISLGLILQKSFTLISELAIRVHQSAIPLSYT